MRSRTGFAWCGFACGVSFCAAGLGWQQDSHGGLDGYITYLRTAWVDTPVWFGPVGMLLPAIVFAICLWAASHDDREATSVTHLKSRESSTRCRERA